MRSEITTIVFSKNRACQLELLLRSMNIPSVVIYTYDAGFNAGYDKLIDMYPHVSFIQQTNFKDQVIENLGEYTMFECDDDVMINPFEENCQEFTEFKNNPEILCLSMRLSPSYKGAPVFQQNTWEWSGLQHSWGYPMSATSHVFRKGDILPMLARAELSIPNSIEVVLRKKPPNRPLMLCFSKPKFINNHVNQVQTQFVNHGLINIPIRELEQRFIDGERLSLEYIKEQAIKARDCFLKIDYEWEIV